MTFSTRLGKIAVGPSSPFAWAGSMRAVAVSLPSGRISTKPSCTRDWISRSVSLALVSDDSALRRLVERHLELTGSDVAARVLARWERAVGEFVEVVPNDVLALREEPPAQDLAPTAVVG